jgi:hypothetical protein
MPVHDWTRVDARIFHAFHHDWITDLSRALNRGLLPRDYYAVPEQLAGAFVPDVLTLQSAPRPPGQPGESDLGAVGLAEPALAATAETDMDFYRRKQKAIGVHHITGDAIVAVIEVVSPGNKSSRTHLRNFVEKAATLIDQGIHLLVIDLLTPTSRDPQGVHGAIWEELSGEEYLQPAGRPLTLASYEAADGARAFVRHPAVGEALPSMPLFLKAKRSVPTPLEQTYMTAFEAMPARLRELIEST